MMASVASDSCEKRGKDLEARVGETCLQVLVLSESKKEALGSKGRYSRE